MSTYAAFVLKENEGQVHRVFLVRKEKPGTQTMPDDELLALRQHTNERYAQDLLPVDLEVLELPELKKRIRKLNTGR
jgi:hypothetical protein